MTAYKHVLVPTDFSDDSRRAAARALELAETFGARLSVVHVVDYLPPSYIYAQSEHTSVAEITERAETCLADWVGQVGLQEAEKFIVNGSAGKQIDGVAKANGVDLIVIGSSGEGGIKRLLGSTTRAVLNEAPCDVLSIHR